MSIDRATDTTAPEALDDGTRAATLHAPSPQLTSDPPNWLTVGLAAAYMIALLGLVFLPGGTLLERLRALDGGICSQLPTHSFYPGGQQLPLCARNTGIYVGFSSTIVFLLSVGRLRATRLPQGWVAAILAAAVLLMGVDGFNSLFLDLRLPHLYQPHNLLRLATGLGTGVAMATFLVPVANGLIWRREDYHTPFFGLAQLGTIVPVLVIAFLAVASQASWLLYPLAIFSSAGLVMALSLINLVFALAITNHVGRMDTIRQLFPVFSVAVALAIVELLALFALKTALLHSLGVSA